MEKKKIPLTIIIPVFNSEYYLEKLILSVIDDVAEILICDSFSTDDTLKIARKYDLPIIQHEYINSAKQKNWAIPQAKNEWVWVIDSDELPEDDLIDEIRHFIENVKEEVDLAYIPRKNLFWGEFMGKASAYPDYQSRLFKRDKGVYQDKEVHAQLEVPGSHIFLKHALVHDDFKDISTWWIRNNRYYQYELDECLKRGVKWSFKLQYIKPLYVFFKFYILRKGFLYGFKGLFVAFQWLVYYFFVGAKLYEYELKLKKNSSNEI
ncbi:glycosyltransferase family 2 protein [uncultured Polaribacter sp.]|uniref:glycosyltransferase family 2 protein n=1 Tax=uncultured Polaribacter sp. TaxID=174711 RepID=UPI00259B33E2|nr:glycosyltransferase family 2 protein [uncultured Polaribacter sp.]